MNTHVYGLTEYNGTAINLAIDPVSIQHIPASSLAQQLVALSIDINARHCIPNMHPIAAEYVAECMTDNYYKN